MRSHPGERAALVAAIAVGLLVAACARIPVRPRGDWLVARTPRFEVASGLSAARTRDLAEQLERFTDVAAELSGQGLPALGVPTRVVVFPRARNYAGARPRREVSGYLQPAPHANFLVIDASESEASLQIARHEIVHLLQLSDPRLPAWLREGGADLLATGVTTGRFIEIGGVPPGHLRVARAAPLSLGRVLAASDVLRWNPRELRGFYAESWALAHYLRFAPDAPPPTALARYVDALAQSRDPGAAARAAFGRSIEQLEGDVLRWVERSELPSERVPAPRRRSRGAVAIAPLADADRDALLGDLALALGERHWKRADRWLRASLAAEPVHPLANATLAWLRALRSEADARAQIERASALGELGAEEQRRIGEAWLALAAQPQPSEARGELVALADAAFARSLALDPSHAAARFGTARLARLRGQPARAARELTGLRGALPALPAVEVELARSQLAAGDDPAARASLKRVIAGSHAAPRARAARNDLRELLADVGISERDAAAGEAARLDVQTPAPGVVTETDVSWIEVRGKAGLWDAAWQDLALVLDVSNSTLEASGVDVDGDGRTGRTLGKRQLAPDRSRRSSDRGDSIARAEIAAAEALVGELDPETTRTSLVLFTAEARLAAPLGPPEDTLAALRRQRVRYDPTGTSFAAALACALDDLIEGRVPARRSQRTVLLLSDGEPTAPNRFEARRQALAMADELARYGVRVHAYALGPKAAEKSETLRELAKRTGGHFSIAADARDVSFLRDARLTGLEDVAIRNNRTGAAARAVRVFADGSFDALVPLAAGENVLEIRAGVAGREPLATQRTVRLVAPTRSTAAHAEQVSALRAALELRTQEIEARARASAERAARARRTLELEASSLATESTPAQ